MNALLLRDARVTRTYPLTGMPRYRFDEKTNLLCATIAADLKQKGDKLSYFKVKILLKRPLLLINSVSKIFRPIVGDTVHLSNDLTAVQQWCVLHKKNAILFKFNEDFNELMIIFDTKTDLENIVLLKTTIR